MKKINRWFKSQAKRSQRFLSIADLLFARKSMAYIYFRLRYFNWLVLIRLSFHLSIFVALHQTLPARNLTQLAGVWSICLIVSSGWWGGLEILRTRIREYYTTKSIVNLEQEISHWLLLGGVGAGILGFLGLTYLAQAIYHLNFNSLFAASLLISTSLRVGFEPYHSGIYAISRIMRPLWSLILGEMLGFFIIIIGWHWLGHWIVPVAILLSGMLNTLLRFKYCQRLYQFYTWQLSVKPLDWLKWLRGLPLKDFSWGFLAMLFIQLEGPVLLASVKFAPGQTFYLQLFNALFLTLPLLNASGEWAQLFYFDWKKLHRFNFVALQQRYDKILLRLSGFLGLGLGLLASLVSHWFLPHLSAAVYGMVVVIITLRAIIAYQQIRAFAGFYYKDVVCSGLLIFLSFAALCLSHLAWILSGLVAGLVATMAWLSSPHTQPVAKASRLKQQVVFYDWLTHLYCLGGSVQITQLQLAPQISYYKLLRIVDWLSQNYLSPEDRICVLANKIIFYQNRPTATKSLEPSSLAIATAGLVRKLVISPVFNCLSARDKLNVYLKQKLIAHGYEPICTSDHRQFFHLFPDGLSFSPEPKLGSQATLADKTSVHSLLYQAELALNSQPAGYYPYEIAVEYAKGTIRTIYAVPRANYSRKQLQAWRRAVDNANIQQIFATETQSWLIHINGSRV